MKTSDALHDRQAAVAESVSHWFKQSAEADKERAACFARTKWPHVQERQRLGFILGACQYPSGLLDRQPAYASWQRLAERVEREGSSADALLLTGDQIYIDVTAGLFDPTQLDDGYRRAYERWLHQPAISRLMARIPPLCMLDDHEIHNNWEPLAKHSDEQLQKGIETALKRGRENYLRYQRASGPFPQAASTDRASPNLWYSLESRGLPVFVADTRTERNHRPVKDLLGAGIMSPEQFHELTAWLQKPELAGLPKIVVSPSILLPRHSRVASTDYKRNGALCTEMQALHSDSWDGYPSSFYNMLSLILEKEIQNVVFVSGDEHLGCFAEARLSRPDRQENEISVYSIHTSALYAPYPFANAHPSDLVAEESFRFQTTQNTKPCQCRVEAEFVSGQGFTLLNFAKDADGRWVMSCEFERADSERDLLFTRTLSV